MQGNQKVLETIIKKNKVLLQVGQNDPVVFSDPTEGKIGRAPCGLVLMELLWLLKQIKIHKIFNYL